MITRSNLIHFPNRRKNLTGGQRTRDRVVLEYLPFCTSRRIHKINIYMYMYIYINTVYYTMCGV